MNTFWLLLIVVIVGGILLVLSRYFTLWLQAYVTETRIGLLSLVFMSLRHVDPRLVVRVRIMAVQAGLMGVSTNAVEAQYLAGGDSHRVVLALIAAHRAGIELDWDTASAIDLSGRDILEAVRISVNPQVIYCPAPEDGNRLTLDGVAKDGIQLKVRALVTVRTNLFQLIGGATEPTVIARVGQGIVSAIGACNSYRDVLANPTIITRQVAEQGLDTQTSFAIVSIDIADISVGKNIGAQLQLSQANADIRVARAIAEKRWAMAVARKQEMLALTREHEALVVRAEAQIPPAIAAAFRRGQLRTRRPSNQERTRRVEPSRKTYREERTAGVASASRAARSLEAWETEGGASASSRQH